MAYERSVGGSFAWHELVSGDLRGEKTLYAQLFGWDVLPIEQQKGILDPISRSGTNIGGFRTPRTGFEAAHWLPSVAVDDLDETVERVVALGGISLTPRTQVPGVGDLSVICDRQGANVGILEVNGAVPSPSLKASPGIFCWDELVCRDVEDALDFYGELFGWGARPAEDRERAWAFLSGDHLIGGVTQAPARFGLPPAWMSFICTDDLRGTVRRARELRFQVAVQRFDLPNFGSIAMVRDPNSAPIGIFEPPTWLRQRWCPEAGSPQPSEGSGAASGSTPVDQGLLS